MSVEERIENIKDYFVEMNIAEGVIYMKAKFPNGWYIDGKLGEDLGVKLAKCNDGSGIFFFGEIKVGFDNIFDVIDKVIKYNEIAELKKSLLMEKIKELQELFNEEDLSVLQTLEFKIKKRKPRVKKTEEKPADEQETANQTENEEEEVEQCQTA